MYKEENHTGFLGSLKSFFSARKASPSDTEMLSDESLVEEYKPIRSPALDSPADRPMRTRTVDFSQAGRLSESTADSRLANSEQSAAALPLEEAKPDQGLDILFASSFIEKGGKFLYCETIEEAIAELRALAQQMSWAHVFCWENEIKDAFCENNFQRGAIGFTIENSNATMCLCETLVADTGSILLNPKQASRRRLPVFPAVQIFLAGSGQIAADLNKALDIFNIKNKGELPSVLDLSDNVKGNYYHDGNLVLKAEGPGDIFVFLVDEKIKPSLRP